MVPGWDYCTRSCTTFLPGGDGFRCHPQKKSTGLTPRSNGPVRIDLETTADAVGETSEQVKDRNEGQPRQESVLNEQSVPRSSNRDRKPPSRFIQEL